MQIVMKKKYTQEEVDKLLEEQRQNIYKAQDEENFRQSIWREFDRTNDFINHKYDELLEKYHNLEDRMVTLEGKKKTRLCENCDNK